MYAKRRWNKKNKKTLTTIDGGWRTQVSGRARQSWVRWCVATNYWAIRHGYMKYSTGQLSPLERTLWWTLWKTTAAVEGSSMETCRSNQINALMNISPSVTMNWRFVKRVYQKADLCIFSPQVYSARWQTFTSNNEVSVPVSQLQDRSMKLNISHSMSACGKLQLKNASCLNVQVKSLVLIWDKNIHSSI